MSAASHDNSFIALIDDDGHSAYLLTRMLLGQGSPDVRHLGDAASGEAALLALLADAGGDWPDLVIVDLKSHSGANLEFLARNQAVLRPKGVRIAVMAQIAGLQAREALLAAGATAVFCRHAELDAYRHEAADIVSFWAQSQRPDAVGM
ncbi:hypothetical protein [Devosia sp. 63-57]|uniref:hypothetical protein n=1 Tax=Devosia sp. 63-57 TaxID=1895751 RepID=UPI00086CBBE9|nr:hypothetical protein [Devosia sp. 63-57]ODT49662.1 MAG: hypothetical protein ABS74_07215 [Pelagibacterium sp. SCN 63-126]ODU87675.1 MAG: hypothetical protein ABT14_04800 [Pelagibacterium sp. SCN 63-17]OJX45676.1 MAG: hypothetical protein BGO80_07785 [Devosia sp. 63-57]